MLIFADNIIRIAVVSHRCGLSFESTHWKEVAAQASRCWDVQLNKKSCGAALMLPPTEEGRRRRRGPGYCSNKNKDECISNNGPVEPHQPPTQHRPPPSKKSKKFRCISCCWLKTTLHRTGQKTSNSARGSTTANKWCASRGNTHTSVKNDTEFVSVVKYMSQEVLMPIWRIITRLRALFNYHRTAHQRSSAVLFITNWNTACPLRCFFFLLSNTKRQTCLKLGLAAVASHQGGEKLDL